MPSFDRDDGRHGRRVTELQRTPTASIHSDSDNNTEFDAADQAHIELITAIDAKKGMLTDHHTELDLDADLDLNERETILADIWRTVLGVEREVQIGRGTNFTALGGNHVAALRVIGRAWSAGLDLPASLRVVQCAPLAELAMAATVVPHDVVTPTPVGGQIPLGPRQHHILACSNVNAQSTSLLLRPQKSINAGDLKDAFAALLFWHDMLRARFVRQRTGNWMQNVQAPGSIVFILTEHALRTADALPMLVQAERQHISVEDGRLHSAALVSLPDGSQRLLLTIHNLVADAHSWTILLDNLEALLTGGKLPLKQSDSYKSWSSEMVACAADFEPAGWEPYLRDSDRQETRVSSTERFTIRVELDEEMARQLPAANMPYRTDVRELILAALVMSKAAYSKRNGDSESEADLRVEIEDHGRYGDTFGMDVAATVGPFASTFPLVLDATTSSTIESVIRHVKQSLRGVPDNGISYGILKHLAWSKSSVKSHKGYNIGFRCDGLGTTYGAGSAAFLTIKREVSAASEGDGGLNPIFISCVQGRDSLVVDFTGSGDVMRESDARAWMESWRKCMRRIVRHCVDPATLGGRDMMDSPLMPSLESIFETEQALHDRYGVTSAQIEDMYPATPLQSGLLAAMIQDASEYTIVNVIDVRGGMGVAKLRAGWAAVARKHASLRTVFCSPGGSGLVQAVLKMDRAKFTVLAGTHSEEEAVVMAERVMAEERARGFRLEDASFMRFTVLLLDDGRVRVVWACHHAVVDGWSIQIILNEWRLACSGTRLDAPLAHFRDHVEWLGKQPRGSSETFWKAMFAGAPESKALSLPVFDEASLGGRSAYTDVLSSVTLRSLEKVCRNLHVTVSSLVRAAWALTLKHYTCSSDVLFGSIVSGRDQGLEGSDGIVGMLINTVPIPIRAPSTMTMAEFLKHAQTLSNDIMAHSHISLLDIQQWIGKQDLIESLVVFQNYPANDGAAEDAYSFEQIDHLEFTSVPITLTVEQHSDEISLKLSFNTRRFDASLINDLLRKFESVLTEMTEGKQTTTLADVDQVIGSSLEKIRNFGASAVQTLPQPELYHQRFEVFAAKSPKSIAVVNGSHQTTYGELDERANAVAHKLRATGVKGGQNVGLIVNRSTEMIVGILGILKAGAAYVIMDAAFPPNRISTMAAEGSCAVILFMDGTLSVLNSLTLGEKPTTFSLSEFVGERFKAAEHKTSKLPDTARGRDNAFVVFTSGSTGKPKGVTVHHFGMTRFLQDDLVTAHLSPASSVSQFNSIGFDMCQFDIFVALSFGATLHLRQADDAMAVLSKVNVVSITPTGLAAMDPAKYPNIEVIYVSGEPLSASLADMWAGRAKLYNTYAPSECSVYALGGLMRVGGEISIGKPMANSKVYILDENDKLVPPGIVGEIVIGGACVTNGYTNSPEGNAERFVMDTISEDGTRMFRSGDLGRWLHNGNLKILGRRDNQVKLRGYRIELDEVANAIGRHPRVNLAAAVVKNDILIGYVSPASFKQAELRELVSKFLPHYMIPSVYICMDKLPLNPNGKIDRQALMRMPQPEIDPEELVLTEHEAVLAEIWKSVLSVDQVIGRNTSFFELGGDSLTVIRMTAAAAKKGFGFNASHVFKLPFLSTLASMASSEEAMIESVQPFGLMDYAVLQSIRQTHFPAVGIAAEDVEDVYPTTPLQFGMLIESMKDPSMYVVNHMWELKNVGFDRIQTGW
ncbi:hypothetical protein HK101_001505, partial [Irineochytrium annulatum]